MSRVILFASILSGFAPFIAGLTMRHRLSSTMRLLLIYFSIDLATELSMAYLGSKGINNLWMVHLFTIIQYGFMIAVFSSWQSNNLIKRMLQVSIPITIVMGIVSMLFLENVRHFNNFSRPITSLILIMASAYTLFELNKEKAISVFQEPRFWISSGTLLYFASTLVLFALSNTLLNLPKHFTHMVFEIHSVMNIVANIIYAIGFLCQVRIP